MVQRCKPPRVRVAAASLITIGAVVGPTLPAWATVHTTSTGQQCAWSDHLNNGHAMETRAVMGWDDVNHTFWAAPNDTTWSYDNKDPDGIGVVTDCYENSTIAAGHIGVASEGWAYGNQNQVWSKCWWTGGDGTGSLEFYYNQTPYTSVDNNTTAVNLYSACGSNQNGFNFRVRARNQIKVPNTIEDFIETSIQHIGK